MTATVRPFSRRRAAQPADAGWDLLLLSVAAYLATAVGRSHQLFEPLAAARPAFIAATLALVLFALTTERVREVRLVGNPVTMLLLMLLGWSLLSVPAALHDGHALRSVVDDFAKTVILYILMVGVTRGRQDVDRLVFVYLIAATLYTVVAFARFAPHGEPRPGDLIYYDPNDFATYAITALPFAAYFMLTRRRLWLWWTATGSAVLLAAGIVWSGSRGGFLALGVAGITAVFLYRSIPWRLRVGLPLAVAVVVVSVAGPRYWERIRTLASPEQDYNLTEEAGRIAVWERGIGYAMDRPVFGVGFQNFAIAEGTISPVAERQRYGKGVKWTVAHNSYIQVAAEVGLPGLVIFLTMLAVATRALYQRATGPPGGIEPDPAGTVLAQSLLVSLAGFAVGSFFLSLAWEAMLYALLALTAALMKVTPPLSDDRRRIAASMRSATLPRVRSA